jgi:hypothetical protein
MLAAATTSAIPWKAATVLRAMLKGNVPRIHGSSQVATTNAYRIAPIASTHQPCVLATKALSTKIRNASTSMSNRAPKGDTVPVRRATGPSTASSASATEATVTMSANGAG